MRENAFSGKQLDNVLKETHDVSVMIPHLETDARGDKKDSRPLLHQKRRHRLMERYPPKVRAVKERALLEREAEFRAEIPFGESVRTCRVIIGILSVCLNYKSESGCTHGDKC